MAGDEGESIEDDEETPLEEIVSGAVTVLTLSIAFGLLFAGFQFFWVAFIVGFAGVLPMALGAVKLYQRRQDGDTTTAAEPEDALEELRQRYARGEFTDEEFERRIELLLETESVADAREYAEAVRAERTAEERARQREYEFDRESG